MVAETHIRMARWETIFTTGIKGYEHITYKKLSQSVDVLKLQQAKVGTILHRNGVQLT